MDAFMNKPVYLGISMLEIGITVMWEFWYDCMNLKYGKKQKLCYMDADNIIIFIIYTRGKNITRLMKDVFDFDALRPKI